jgi:predicted phage terminase large subunit-like protein
MTSNLAFDETELLQSVCRDSFEQFVKEFWSTFIPEKLVWNWHMTYLCQELQKGAERVFAGLPREYDLVINIPPGTSKSSIGTVLFPAWCWTRMPSARILGGSYAAPLALDLARKGREVVRSEKYQRLFPQVGKLRGDQDLKSHYENEHGGARYAVGVGGSITGFHSHILIIDDPLNPEEAAQEGQLKQANRWMSETLPTRKVDKAVSWSVLIMQRLHQNDPSGNLLSKAGPDNPVKHICLPGEETESIKPGKLRRFYVNGLLDPHRLSRRVLNGLRAELLEYGYSGQILQSPVPPGGGQFKSDRIVADTPPLSFVKKVRGWDKAATAGAGDYCVGVLMGKDAAGRFWILDVIRGQWDSFRREEIIANTAEMDGEETVIMLEQEPGSGGLDSTKGTIKNLAGFRVRSTKPTGDKSLRADPFSVQVNAGNVSIRKGAPWVMAYLEELRFFPFGTHDDQIDASSVAFNFLADRKVRVGGLGR